MAANLPERRKAISLDKMQQRTKRKKRRIL